MEEYSLENVPEKVSFYILGGQLLVAFLVLEGKTVYVHDQDLRGWLQLDLVREAFALASIAFVVSQVLTLLRFKGCSI